MRTIPLARNVVQQIKAWKLRSKFSKPDNLTFPNRRGQFMNHVNFIRREWCALFDTIEAKHGQDPEDAPRPAERFNRYALQHFAINTSIGTKLSPKAEEGRELVA